MPGVLFPVLKTSTQHPADGPEWPRPPVTKGTSMPRDRCPRLTTVARHCRDVGSRPTAVRRPAWSATLGSQDTKYGLMARAGTRRVIDTRDVERAQDRHSEATRGDSSPATSRSSGVARRSARSAPWVVRAVLRAAQRASRRRRPHPGISSPARGSRTESGGCGLAPEWTDARSPETGGSCEFATTSRELAHPFTWGDSQVRGVRLVRAATSEAAGPQS